jgi:ribosomal protein S1
MRFVPYGVFIKVFDDINGLIHLSELSQKSVQNPNEIVKIGEKVKAKLILLDIKNRKIGLSMKDIDKDGNPVERKPSKKPVAKGPTKGLEDVVKRLEEDAE